MTKERFSLSQLLGSGIDVDDWPEPELSSLSEHDRIRSENRIAAIKSYIKYGYSLKEIHSNFGIGKSTLYRLIERSLTIVNGELLGYLAVIPHRRWGCRSDLTSERHQRGDAGTSGAFSRLLKGLPSLDERLQIQVETFKTKKNGGERVSDLHQAFLRECRQVGLGGNDYPFNSSDKARRSFEEHLKKRYQKYRAELELAHADRDLESIESLEPLDEVQADGHEVDIRLVIEERDLYGETVRYEILRVWIITIIDVFSRCILGYSIALGKNYDQQDVLSAIYNALSPHQKPEAVIKGAVYSMEGGFPSERGEEFAWGTWRSIKLDNALSIKPCTSNTF